MVGRGRKVPGIGCRPELAKAGVDLAATRGVEGARDPVADPLEHGHVAGRAGQVLRGGVAVDESFESGAGDSSWASHAVSASTAASPSATTEKGTRPSVGGVNGRQMRASVFPE
jgi:hypothetical protein